MPRVTPNLRHSSNRRLIDYRASWVVELDAMKQLPCSGNEKRKRLCENWWNLSFMKRNILNSPTKLTVVFAKRPWNNVRTRLWQHPASISSMNSASGCGSTKNFITMCEFAQESLIQKILSNQLAAQCALFLYLKMIAPERTDLIAQ